MFTSEAQSYLSTNSTSSKIDTMAETTKSQEHDIVSADESQDGQIPGALCPDSHECPGVIRWRHDKGEAT